MEADIAPLEVASNRGDLEAAANSHHERPGPAAAHSFRRANTSRAVRIVLKDLTYTVKHSQKRGEVAVLLNNVTAHLNPGEMSALMGPSGSGKTTLLDLLAGRKTTGSTAGTIQFGGVTPTKEYLRRYTGYVEQFDTLLGILTVWEMLLYTAELKRPLTEPLENKRKAVEELLLSIGLDVCRNVLIGSPTARGISGGQAKRVNVAIALITNPRVLFLDEPTTGLDSFTSNEVLSVIKGIAEEGVTVCATIHSPSSYCFNLFDRVLMLVSGRTVYFGERASIVDFFNSVCPHVKDQIPGYNDAEYITDIVVEADRLGKGRDFSDAYANSSLCAENAAAVDQFLLSEKTNLTEEAVRELQVKRSTVTPWWWGMWVFAKYRASKNYRSPPFVAARVMDKLFITLLVMTLYLGIGDDMSDSNVINIAAVLFMWSASPAFAASGYLPSIVLERGLYVRERADGLYLPVTYLLSKLSEEIVLNWLVSLPICAILFYGVQLQGEFVLFYIVYIVALSIGISIAYFVASFAPNMDAANGILATYCVSLLFFCGFLIRFPDIPPWWYWYSFLDFARYAWGANMINQFSGRTQVWIDGMTVLQYYGLSGNSKWAYCGYASLFFLFFFLCTLLVLTYKKYEVR